LFNSKLNGRKLGFNTPLTGKISQVGLQLKLSFRIRL